MGEAITLTTREREKLTERLHSYLGFYINPVIEDGFAAAVEQIVEARLEPLIALADGWQAEVEDDGDGLTPLDTVLRELRAALADPDAAR